MSPPPSAVTHAEPEGFTKPAGLHQELACCRREADLGEVYGHSAHVYGQYLWVVGGQKRREPGSRCALFRWSLAAGWEDLSESSQPDRDGPCCRWGHTGCVVGSKLFFLGGFDCQMNHHDWHVLDFETGRWNRGLAHMGQRMVPVFGAYHSAAPLSGDDVIVFGSMRCVGGPYAFTNAAHVINLSTGEFGEIQTTGEPPCPRAQCTAFLNGSKLYIYGGSDAGNVFNDLHSLDLSAQPPAWSFVPTTGSAPPAFEGSFQADYCLRSCRAQGFVRNGSLLLMSEVGHNLGLYVLDLASFAWRLARTPPVPWRGGFAAATRRDDLFILGGHSFGQRGSYNTPFGSSEELVQSNMTVLKLRSRPGWEVERLLWMGVTVRSGVYLNPRCGLRLPEVVGTILSFLMGPVEQLDWPSAPTAGLTVPSDHRGFWR